jgi:hypothetical protein
MTDLQKLREPFPDSQIGKLPRVWCKDCRDAKPMACGKGAPVHKIAKCSVCNQKGSTAHLHLDYVGHAEVTHRLLDVDPQWTWEPFGVDSSGLPAVTKDGNDWSLWIRLTIGGVTKPGVGCLTVERFTTEPYKQLISDAIRNASMRFGVALDLWAKSELDHTSADQPSADGGGRAETPPIPSSAPAANLSSGSTQDEPGSATAVTPQASSPTSSPQSNAAAPTGSGGEGREAALPPDQLRSDLRERIERLTDAQRLQLKALWTGARLVALDKAEITDDYYEKAVGLIGRAAA